jgi:hypothetical protein
MWLIHLIWKCLSVSLLEQWNKGCDAARQWRLSLQAFLVGNVLFRSCCYHFVTLVWCQHETIYAWYVIEISTELYHCSSEKMKIRLQSRNVCCHLVEIVLCSILLFKLIQIKNVYIFSWPDSP